MARLDWSSSSAEWKLGRARVHLGFAAALGAIALVASLSADANPDATLRDEFTESGWDGSHGSLQWSGDWVESEGDGPAAGTIQIAEKGSGHCAAGSCLRLGGAGAPSGSIERRADLSQALAAEVRFAWAIDAELGFWAEHTAATVDISSDGGASWTTLHTFPEGEFGPVDQHAIYDVAEWVGSEIAIRVTANEAPELVGFIYLDDIEIVPLLNEAPEAHPDEAASTGEPVTIDVLANDFDADGHMLSVTQVTAPRNGSIELAPDGAVTYTPPPGWEGEDEFSYQVTDGIAFAEGVVRVVSAAEDPGDVADEPEPAPPPQPDPTWSTDPPADPEPEPVPNEDAAGVVGKQAPVKAPDQPSSSPGMDARQWGDAVGPVMAGEGLAFEANMGQADAGLDAIAQAAGYAAVLAGGDVTLMAEGHDVVMRLRGAAPRRAMDPVTEPPRQSSVTDPEADPGVESPRLTSVAYRDVYPGIDIQYLADGDELEYRFIIAPGADHRVITLDFAGVGHPSLNEAGDLMLGTEAEPRLLSTAPVTFQDSPDGRVIVRSAYALREDGTVGFEIGPYDANLPLVIDPTFRAVSGSSTGVSASISIPTPAGVIAGDVMIAALALRDPQPDLVVTAPEWIPIREDLVAGEQSQHLFYKVATDSEPATYVLSYNQSLEAAGAIAAYSGVDISDPIDAHGFQFNPVSPPTAPSITTTAANTTLVAVFGSKNGVAIDPPAGMAERWDEPGTISIEGADEVFAGPGPTGARSSSTGASPTIGQLIALRQNPGFVVNSTADVVDNNIGDGVCDTGGLVGPDPECTLRAAVQEANAFAGADTIQVPGGLYTFTIAGSGDASVGDLNLTTDMTIRGADMTSTIIDAALLDRAFDVPSATTVTISDLTLRNGRTVVNGGGIRTNGTLTLDRVSLQNNEGSNGGGIRNDGTLTMTDVELIANTATADGGGMFNNGTVTWIRGTGSGNTAGNGGGIRNAGPAGQTLSLTNLTLSGNSVGAGNGGGLYTQRGVVAVNVTTADNIGGTGAGFHVAGGGSVDLRNTLVANNGCTVPVTAIGGNIESPGDTCGLETPNVTPAALNLGSLADNGGPTQTHRLVAPSAAVDAGIDTACVGPGHDTDQRGAVRPVDFEGDGIGPLCDIGAFELSGSQSVVSTWLTTRADVPAPNGAPGLDAWSAGEAIALGDPNLALEPGITDGTFSRVFDLDAHVQDANAEIDALHYVTTSLTVGTANAVTLQPGDLLFSTELGETYPAAGFAAEDEDVIRFQPAIPGDYSAGTFSLLLDLGSINLDDTRALTLVERETTVGDVTVSAGTFVIGRQNRRDLI